MKRYLSYLVLLLVTVFSSFAGRANHIFGGDLLYTNVVNDSTYEIKLTLYGDCKRSDLLADLYTAHPTVYLLQGNIKVDSFLVSLQSGSGNEVTPVCPSQLSQTECNGGTLPGVRQFIFTNTIIVHKKAADLQFAFFGKINSSQVAGRSSAIGTINNAGSSILQLYATLNNLNGPNSSPQYSTIPTPFYCVNVPEQYNQGAIDPNGDSLVFALVSALDGSNGLTGSTGSSVPVVYTPPYSATHPFSTASGAFSFTPLNGQLSFTADLLQNALVVTKVYEYRNGQLVGSSVREMTFIMEDNCAGVQPVASLTEVMGATITDGTVINICRGTPYVSFDIHIDNPDNDTTYVTPAAVPAGASLTVVNDSTPFPAATFGWNTSALANGAYSFYLTIKNNHCPLANTQTIAYTINVTDPPLLSATQLTQTQCVHQAAIEFDMVKGFLPRVVTVSEGGTVVKTITDSVGPLDNGIIIDSLPAGSYTATVSSGSSCASSIAINITDSGSIPNNEVDFSLCKNDPVVPLPLLPIKPGAIITWYTQDGTLLPAAPSPNTFQTGELTYYFIEDYKTCTTGPDTVKVVVHDLPTATILNIPSTICYGDVIYLQASGGVQYTWEPTSLVKQDTGGYYVELLLPAQLTVVVTDSAGCKDSASVVYSDIQPCCNFSYPTAFTPNNDGKNDGFRIVTYGNMLRYSLSIYNRWGQWIFWTADPDKVWDGTFNGKPCEADVYYYIMEGQCLTGRKERHTGDITLIR